MTFFRPILLECLLTLLALVTLVGVALRPPKPAQVRTLGHLLAAAVFAWFAASLALVPSNESFFGGSFRLDAFALFFKRLFLAATALSLLAAAEFAPALRRHGAELYVLMLLAAVGMLVVASAHDFILMFVSLELVTVSFYVMTSLLRGSGPSVEAGTKYLIMGALSGALTVYGISWLFGAAGATSFEGVAAVLRGGAAPPAAFTLGMLFVLAGLSFKIAAVPGQMWAPDVYQGAPTPVTAFLSTGSKAAGFALLARLLLEVFRGAEDQWRLLLVVISGLTILYGNLGALAQTSVKRLYGYSSIAHAGYLLMGLCAGSELGAAAVLFYLAQYAVTNLCGFLALTAAMNTTGSDDLRALAGLHRRAPLAAAGLAVSALSLAGIPPFSGFFAKFALFASAVQRGPADPAFYALVGVAAAGALASVYFYFRVVRAVLAGEPADAAPVPASRPLRAALAAALVVVVVLGVWPVPVFEPALHAVAAWAAP